MESLRDSTESIDTVDVLLPLLERLGIRVPSTVYTDLLSENKHEEEEEDDDDEVVYHVGDEDFCVFIEETRTDRCMPSAASEERLEGDIIERKPSCLYPPGEVSTLPESLNDCTNTATYAEPMYAKNLSHASYTKQRHDLAKEMYRRYNDIIFEGILPADLDISWNARLSTTAGLTHYKRDAYQKYSARIELSTKVLDTAEKLERTLIHEMCHCATWLIDHIARPPHGEHFKKHAARAMLLVPHVNVSTCHNYDIFYPFRWQCSSCQHEYGRHSKSIDVSTKVCDKCNGMLVFLGRFSRDGSPQKRVISAYSVYVKEHFSRVKESLGPGTISASDVMKRIAEEWKTRQEEPFVLQTC